MSDALHLNKRVSNDFFFFFWLLTGNGPIGS